MLRNVSVLAYFLVFPLEISFHYLLIQIFGRPKVPLRFFGKSLKRGHSGGITKLKAKIPHNSWQFSDQEEQTFPLCKFLLIPSWQKVGVTLYEAIPIHNILSRKTQKLVLHFPKWLYNWLVRTSNLFTTAPLNSSGLNAAAVALFLEEAKTIIHMETVSKLKLESVSNIELLPQKWWF